MQLGPNSTYKLRRCSDHKLIKSLINALRTCHYKGPFILRYVPQAPPHAPEALDDAPLQAGDQDDIIEVPDDTAPDPPNNNPAPDPPDNNQIPGPPNDISQGTAQPAQTNPNNADQQHTVHLNTQNQKQNHPNDTQTSQQSDDTYYEVEKLLKMRFVDNKR